MISIDEYEDKLKLSAAITSCRQAAEWGMRSVRSKMPRLAVPLAVNDRERKLILETAVKLYNLKIKLIGLSQISTVYAE